MSSLSALEMIQIIASWKRRSSPAKRQIDRTRYSEEQLKAFDEHVRANFQPVTVLGVFTFKVDWERFDEFPCFHFYMEAFRDFEARRVYPHAGSLDSQPARTVEILKLIEALSAEDRAKEIRKQEAIRVRS